VNREDWLSPHTREAGREGLFLNPKPYRNKKLQRGGRNAHSRKGTERKNKSPAAFTLPTRKGEKNLVS